MSFTLITGASHGIGKAMAEKCGKSGKNLVLIALASPELRDTAQELRDRYGVVVHCMGIDLTQEGATQKVYQFCQDRSLAIDTLISNAGFGRGGRFESTPVEEYQSMMKFNNQTMVELTFHFMEHLKAQPKAWIMYTSSMEATLPLPYKATYTGTKAFIYAFALAIREELRSSNVQVSILCPGSTLTNEDGLKRIQSMGKKAEWVLSTPDFVAETALSEMYKGKAVIIPGKLNWMIVKILRVVPTLWKMRLLERFFRAYRDQ